MKDWMQSSYKLCADFLLKYHLRIIGLLIVIIFIGLIHYDAAEVIRTISTVLISIVALIGLCIWRYQERYPHRIEQFKELLRNVYMYKKEQLVCATYTETISTLAFPKEHRTHEGLKNLLCNKEAMPYKALSKYSMEASALHDQIQVDLDILELIGAKQEILEKIKEKLSKCCEYDKYLLRFDEYKDYSKLNKDELEKISTGLDIFTYKNIMENANELIGAVKQSLV